MIIQEYALNLKNKLHALIREYNTNQGMILRNLDYLIYHNDWQGVIQLCNNEYENAETDLPPDGRTDVPFRLSRRDPG